MRRILTSAVLCSLCVLLCAAAAAAECETWYHPASPWRQPIGADAEVIEDPAYYVDGDPAKGMRAFAGLTLTSDTSQYTYPVHRVDRSMAEVEIVFRGVLSEVVDDDGDGDEDRTIRHRWGTGRCTVHLDPKARYEIPAGSDRQFIFLNTDTGAEVGVWQVEDRDRDGLWEPWDGERCENGYVYNAKKWLGYPPSHASDNNRQFMSRGAGVPYGAGLIRRCEIEAGRIEHAIAFAFPRNHDSAHVFPATRTDGYKMPGDGDLGATLAEGQLVQLDPSISEQTLRAWGLSEAGLVIARALQEYGMRTVDNSGSLKLIAEHESTARWSVLPEEHAVVRETVSRIPVEHFRPIASPHPFNAQVDVHEYAMEYRVQQLEQAVRSLEDRVTDIEATLERVRGAIDGLNRREQR